MVAACKAVEFFPEKSRPLKNTAGTPDNYFLAIADGPNEEEAQVRTKRIKTS